jgi:hypothetical protein
MSPAKYGTDWVLGLLSAGDNGEKKIVSYGVPGVLHISGTQDHRPGQQLELRGHSKGSSKTR